MSILIRRIDGGNFQHFPKWMYVVGGVMAIAISLSLLGRSGAAKIMAIPLQKETSKDWNSIAVQIEQLWSDGKWHPQEPLILNHGFVIQGHGVGRPDFEVKMEPMYRVAGEPKSLYLARSITASCADGSSAIATVLHDASNADWQGWFRCKEGIWRMKIVDAALAAHPPVAKPGEALQMLPHNE